MVWKYPDQYPVNLPIGAGHLPYQTLSGSSNDFSEDFDRQSLPHIVNMLVLFNNRLEQLFSRSGPGSLVKEIIAWPSFLHQNRVNYHECDA